MTIEARVIVDSISPEGIRLTTLQLRYPKFIHGEAKTHRVMRIGDCLVDLMQEVGFMDDPNLSRNASSSRAIPVERLVRDVMDDPVYPMHWGANQSGMQAHKEHNGWVAIGDTVSMPRSDAWDLARKSAVEFARAFAEAGYHKQIVNRLIEPFCHINVVVTATEWSNFFTLRDHTDAQPEIKFLAMVMKAAMAGSTPNKLSRGDWHLPYVDRSTELYTEETLIKVSVARCARVSYLTQDGKKPDLKSDLALYDRLVGSQPIHASPAEHQATPDYFLNVETFDWAHKHLHGNLRGWIQHRKTLVGENQ